MSHIQHISARFSASRLVKSSVRGEVSLHKGALRSICRFSLQVPPGEKELKVLKSPKVKQTGKQSFEVENESANSKLPSIVIKYSMPNVEEPPLWLRLSVKRKGPTCVLSVQYMPSSKNTTHLDDVAISIRLDSTCSLLKANPR